MARITITILIMAKITITIVIMAVITITIVTMCLLAGDFPDLGRMQAQLAESDFGSFPRLNSSLVAGVDEMMRWDITCFIYSYSYTHVLLYSYSYILLCSYTHKLIYSYTGMTSPAS